MTEAVPKASPTPEDVQHDMQATRAALGAGVQALGDKAVGYANDVTEAVGDVYRGTRDALHAARDAVRHVATDGAAYARHAAADATAFAGRALDVRRHVRRYPWLAVGTAVALGFVCGRFIGRR
jgi:ElaB/YqjD/DUF883 family membrane-anchored ribosome-binding protein